MKKNTKGNCIVCGKFEKLTFEHIPPKGAFNNNQIKIKKFENIFEKESYLFQKTSKLNKGYGKYCLCSDCNNFFGGAYCNEYIETIKQCMNFFENIEKIKRINDIPLKIKPLNVLKQIVAIYVCLNSGYIDEQDKSDLKKFLLEKEIQYLPEKYTFYIFNTFNTLPRWLGNQTIYQNGVIVNYSEMIFSPFGIQIFYNSKPTNLTMINITDFKKFRYNEEVNLILRLPIMEINNQLYNSE